jgi:tetratricopeptide (TPR) repeat protein
MKGDFDRAIADYTKAIDIDPNYAHAHYNRGDTYQSSEQLLLQHAMIVSLKS